MRRKWSHTDLRGRCRENGHYELICSCTMAASLANRGKPFPCQCIRTTLKYTCCTDRMFLTEKKRMRWSCFSAVNLYKWVMSWKMWPVGSVFQSKVKYQDKNLTFMPLIMKEECLTDNTKHNFRNNTWFSLVKIRKVSRLLAIHCRESYELSTPSFNCKSWFLRREWKDRNCFHLNNKYSVRKWNPRSFSFNKCAFAHNFTQEFFLSLCHLSLLSNCVQHWSNGLPFSVKHTWIRHEKALWGRFDVWLFAEDKLVQVHNFTANVFRESFHHLLWCYAQEVKSKHMHSLWWITNKIK